MLNHEEVTHKNVTCMRWEHNGFLRVNTVWGEHLPFKQGGVCEYNTMQGNLTPSEGGE